MSVRLAVALSITQRFSRLLAGQCDDDLVPSTGLAVKVSFLLDAGQIVPRIVMTKGDVEAILRFAPISAAEFSELGVDLYNLESLTEHVRVYEQDVDDVIVALQINGRRFEHETSRHALHGLINFLTPEPDDVRFAEPALESE